MPQKKSNASNYITIVMYHYIRELKHSRFPEIKGITPASFENQLLYFKKYYDIIQMKDLIGAIKGEEELPGNALLLTFDDGYIDHYTNVLPLLIKYNLKGCFFPSAKPLFENSVLDVNKIHFLLATVSDKSLLLKEIFREIDSQRNLYNLPENRLLRDKYGIKNYFDTKEVVLIKSLLQWVLPAKLREHIISNLFAKYVTKDEKAFSFELYFNLDQLQLMKNCGMYIGCHGYNHLWLNTLSRKEQRKEIDLSIKFLRMVDRQKNDMVMCYPFGGYNEELISLIQSLGFVAGLTTDVGLSDIKSDNPYKLCRIDTTDFPMQKNHKISKWTKNLPDIKASVGKKAGKF